MIGPKKDIEEEVREEIRQRLKQDKMIKQKIEEEVDKDLDELISLEVQSVLKEEVEGKETTEEADNYKKPISAFRRYFHLCWQGSCRSILLVMVVAYILTIFLMLICPLFNVSGVCISQSILGASVYISYVAIATFIVAIILSLLSPSSRTALIFSFFLSAPLAILLLITSIRYIGLVLVVLVIFNLIIQGSRS